MAQGTTRLWTRETFNLDECFVNLPDECVREFDTFLNGSAVRFTAIKDLMARIRDLLVHGQGMAIIQNMPVERYSVRDNGGIGRLLSAQLGQVVAQTWTGTTVYDVKDTGKELGEGVRRSQTNLGQPFHTDGGFLFYPPQFVGLLCLEQAADGGDSDLVSLAHAHKIAVKELVWRLGLPFYWHRQREHILGEVPASSYPVFEKTDPCGLVVRWYEDYIINGYKVVGKTLDESGHEALEFLRHILDAERSWVRFRLQKGSFQFVNNWELAHRRTAYEKGSFRHLLRFWTRTKGLWTLEGF